MKKTLLGHFYNEEWLLPFWLKHHRDIFDHGILFDYDSSDRSVEIIREMCPTWEVVPSRNNTFEAHVVDEEIVDEEAKITGWRVCLNTTEFLVGNYKHLDDQPEQTRIIADTYCFVDMEDQEQVKTLDVNRPLWEQRYWGYGPEEFTGEMSRGSAPRSARSIHNYAAPYEKVGRHFWGHKGTYDDLAVFHYGYAGAEPAAVKRRLQIQRRCPGGFHTRTQHHMSETEMWIRLREEQQPISRDLRKEIEPMVSAHKALIV